MPTSERQPTSGFALLFWCKTFDFCIRNRRLRILVMNGCPLSRLQVIHRNDHKWAIVLRKPEWL